MTAKLFYRVRWLLTERRVVLGADDTGICAGSTAHLLLARCWLLSNVHAVAAASVSDAYMLARMSL
jgi:hypothetical protein